MGFVRSAYLSYPTGFDSLHGPLARTSVRLWIFFTTVLDGNAMPGP